MTELPRRSGRVSARLAALRLLARPALPRRGHPDAGSGNVGATNVFRLYGKALGVAVALLDVTKGLAAALLGLAVGGALVGVLAGAAAMLGHARPVFLRFQKGGKMVATAGGAALALAPLAALSCARGLARHLPRLPLRVPGVDRDRARAPVLHLALRLRVADRRVHDGRSRRRSSLSTTATSAACSRVPSIASSSGARTAPERRATGYEDSQSASEVWRPGSAVASSVRSSPTVP